MPVETVSQNQIDYKILITVTEDNAIVDLSSATVKKVKIWKPSGELIEGTASYETDGTDGKIYYATVDGDLDELGWYTFRAYLEVGSFIGHTRKGRFLVEAL